LLVYQDIYASIPREKQTTIRRAEKPIPPIKMQGYIKRHSLTRLMGSCSDRSARDVDPQMRSIIII